MLKRVESLMKILAVLLLIMTPVFNLSTMANLPEDPPEEKENPQEIYTPIYGEVLAGYEDMGGMEIVDYEEIPVLDECGCETGETEYIPIEGWVEDWQPVYETGIVDWDVSVECIELKIPFGRAVYQPLFRQPYFFLRYDKPSERIFSPSGIFFCSPFTSYIQTITSDDAGTYFKVTQWNGNPLEFTISANSSSGATSGKYTGTQATIKMLDESGSATLNPYYYEIEFGDGVKTRYAASSRRAISVTTSAGVVLKPEDKGIGLEIIRDENDYICQIYSAADGLASIVIPDGYEGIKYEIRLYSPENAGTKNNGLYVPTGVPHTVWTIENTNSPSIDSIRFTKTRGTVSTAYNWQYTEASEKWTLDSAGLKTMSKSKEWNEDKTELLTTTQRRNADGTLVIQEYENLHKYDFGTRPYKKSVGAKSGESGPTLETTISYYEDSSETGKYGKEKQIVYSTGKWERYDYDAEGRKITIQRPFMNSSSSATSGIVTINQSYSAVDSNDTPLSKDTRPRTVEEKIDGVTVKKVYFAYYTNTSEEKVEITEAAVASTSSYGSSENARRTEVHYASTVDAPAAGKTKYVIYPDGTKDSFTYEFGNISNPGTPSQVTFSPDSSGYCIRITTIHGTSENDNGIAYKSTKNVDVINEQGDLVLKEKYVYIGSAYSRIIWEYRGYNSEHHVISNYFSDNTQSNFTWNCCNMESETGESGIEYTYSYDLLNRMITKTKKGLSGSTADIVTTYAYDAANRVLSETTSSGSNSLSKLKTYDICGRITSETDSSGLTTNITYTNPMSSSGIIITRTMPDGSTKITEKYFDGTIKSITGTAVVPEYFEYGIDSSTGEKWEKKYIGSSNSPFWHKTYTNMLGKVSKVESSGYNNSTITKQNYYNSKGQRIKVSQTGLADTLYEYDELGNLIRKGLDIDANGSLDLASNDRINDKEELFSLLESSWWLSKTNKIYAIDNNNTATTTSIRQDRLTGLASGTISEYKLTDINGNITTVTSTVDRTAKTLTKTTDFPDSTIDEVIVTTNGLLTSKRTTSDLVYTCAYDSLERIIEKTSPRIGSANTAYYTNGIGKRGKIHTVSDVANNVTTYDYNTSTGRLESQENALGKKTYYSYNDRGQIINIFGDTSYPIEKSYNSYGRLISLKTYRNGTGWTNSAWPTSTTGAADTTTWTYDESSGLITSKTFADGNSTTYTYSSDGKLLTRTWTRLSEGSSLSTTYSYDSNTGENTSINYSDLTSDMTFSYTRTGQQYQITDAVGTRTFSYNTALQPATETISGLYSKTITKNYATSGMIGRYFGFNIGTEHNKALGYDDYGRVNTVARDSDTFSYSFLANSDLVASITKTNNLSTTFSYESNRDLITAVNNQYNSTSISNYGYVNDAISRRISMSRSGSAFSIADAITYSYNDRSEVTGAQSDNISSYAYGYSFDNIGNRLTASLVSTDWTYSANNLNQYTSASDGNNTYTPTYNADGCMTTYGDWTYTWNAENRLVSAISSDTKLEYTYDYTGRRVEKKVYSGSATTGWSLSKDIKFVYDEFKLIEELDGSNENAVLRKYLWNDETLLYVTDTAASATYYYQADANKNIGQLMDSSGNIVAKYEYSPFGQIITKSGTYAETNPFRFSSEYYDEETGLVYYNYRYYNSILGKWLSRDPIEEKGGWNLYGIVNNNTININDYNGLIAPLKLGGALLVKAMQIARCYSKASAEYERNIKACYILHSGTPCKLEKCLLAQRLLYHVECGACVVSFNGWDYPNSDK